MNTHICKVKMNLKKNRTNICLGSQCRFRSPFSSCDRLLAGRVSKQNQALQVRDKSALVYLGHLSLLIATLDFQREDSAD